VNAPPEHPPKGRRSYADLPFYCALGGLSATYVVLILAVLAALALFRPPGAPLGYMLRVMLKVLASPEIRYSAGMSLVSCTVTTLLSLLVAVPTGYLLSRRRFFGRGLIDAIFDIPIVLPPLVIGLGLLFLFQTRLGHAVERIVPVTYEIPSVILAQFTVACAFAVRTMQVTFAQINPRQEQVALTLGCGRAQAFFRVALPEARRGVLTAATLAWARALGEFGPILVFSGATRFRTEVLPTSVFLELSIGNIEAAAAVSLVMIVIALAVLLVARAFGLRGTGLI
jgi:molybdate transport system permease protein